MCASLVVGCDILSPVLQSLAIHTGKTDPQAIVRDQLTNSKRLQHASLFHGAQSCYER